MIHLAVTIPLASTWPSAEEVSARNAVGTVLDEANVGTSTGEGSGFWQMLLTYRVVDETTIPAARSVIAHAMEMHMPKHEYSVEVSDR